MDIPNLRWWGWGTADETYPLDNRPRFWPTLRAWLELPAELPQRQHVPLNEIALRPPRLDTSALAWLEGLVGREHVRTDLRTRVEHSYGKAYKDLVRIRTGDIPNPPDVVVYPGDEKLIASLLAWAADHDVVVIPFGGGSSVLGGVEPPLGDRPTLSLDMARMDRLVSLDRVSHTARFEAGATGPEVESQLNAQGFTLGHFPQSFEFSTLGGWIATRAAGQTSTGYGKIEEMTQAVRVLTPVGLIETRDVPASATGPSLLGALVGSEGAYGVITEATVRIHPFPSVQDYRGFLFHSLEDGACALRDLLQQGPRPTIARLSDAKETAGFSMLAHGHRGARAVADWAIEKYLGSRGYSLTEGSCVLILGYDGEPKAVAETWHKAADICKACHGMAVGRSAGETWKRDRFRQPYLRDTLMDVGVFVDTLETATTWANLLNVYNSMTEAIETAIRDSGGGPGYVMTHVSHVYETGASLYTTFMGRQAPEQEINQWWAIKHAATDAILKAGGTLSHHHGIGRDHARYLPREVGETGMALLRSVKKTVDPANIMTPGVLLTEPSESGAQED